MIETIKDFGLIVGVPVARSVFGWASKALEDKKITQFEWKQLISTVLKVGLMGTVAYFGLDSIGVNNSAEIAAVGAFFADKIFNALKKPKKK